MNSLKKYISELNPPGPVSRRKLESAICLYENTIAVKTILQRMKDIDMNLPISKTTPLQFAISLKNHFAISALLDKGADVEKKGNSDLTPLLSACQSGFLQGVILLIQHGVDTNACSPDGLTCLMLAAFHKHLSVVSYLLDQEPCPLNGKDRNGFTALHYIVALNDASMTSKAISKGPDINSQTDDGESVVYFATKKSCLNSLRVLMEAGADPNLCTKAGRCPFWSALDQRNTEALRILLAHKADFTTLKEGGTSALELAILEEDVTLMKLLLEQGVDTEHNGPRTALMTVCNNGFSNGVQLLIDHEANINAKNQDARTVLHKAAEDNNVEAVQLLIENGADMEARTKDELTCLIVAIKNQCTEVVSYLLEQDDCPINGIMQNTFSLLHYVVLLNDPHSTSLLISKGVDINAMNEDIETPVLFAAKHNCVESLRVLLEAGADPNVISKNGDFALKRAANEGFLDATMMLSDHGANRASIGSDSVSPVDLALSVAVLKHVKACVFSIENQDYDPIEARKRNMNEAIKSHVIDSIKAALLEGLVAGLTS
eukprot:g6641.t1